MERRRGPSLPSLGARPGAGRRRVPGRSAAPPPGTSEWPGVGGGPRGRRLARLVRTRVLSPIGGRPSGRGGRDRGSHHLPRAGPRDIFSLVTQTAVLCDRIRNPILQSRKLGPKELAQGHAAPKSQDRDSNPCSPSESGILTSTCALTFPKFTDEPT